MSEPREWTVIQSKYDVHQGLYKPSDDSWLDAQLKMDAWEKISVIEKSAYDLLRAENQRLRAALESIEWITGNLDGSKDTCEIDRKLVQEALEEKD